MVGQVTQKDETMTEPATPPAKKTTKKTAKKTTRKAPAGPNREQLVQQAREAQQAADEATAELGEMRSQIARLELQLAGAEPPGGPVADEPVGPIDRPMTAAELERYKELCRKEFDLGALELQVRSVCKDCNGLRGYRDTCQRHAWVADGQCPWSMDTPTGPLTCEGGHNTSGLHLPYVGHAALTNRLIEIDPWWKVRFHGVDPTTGNPAPIQNEKTMAYCIDLTICGITHTDFGTAKRGSENALQSCYGNALRRAAMRHGLALYLWAKGDLEKFEIGGEGESSPAEATSGPADPSTPSPAADTDLELVNEGQMSKLNQEAALIADPKERAAARGHIRWEIMADRTRKLLTVDEYADAMAYLASVQAEADAAGPAEAGAPEDDEWSDTTGANDEPETGTEPSGDAAPAEGGERVEPGQGEQEGDPSPEPVDSGADAPAEYSLESLQARLLTFKGRKPKELKEALEAADLWPIADHLDEAQAVWFIMDEVEAE